MQKLSVVIFAKDDLEQALGLIKDVYDVADEIVLMDASGKKERDWIAREKKRLRLDKLRIFEVIALGYREPLMAYALSMCRNKWILDLDTDMLPSEQLKRELQKLILDQRYDAYAIGLYSVYGAHKRVFGSYQERLFRKDKIEFRGLVHEKPIVHGNWYNLPRQTHYINHMVTDMEHTAIDSYTKMERFERFTYGQHNKLILEQVDRIKRKAQVDGVNLSVWRRALLATLRLYEALGFKFEHKEVSNFDYFLFYFFKGIVFQKRRAGLLRGLATALPNARAYMEKMKEWRSGRYGDEDFEIAKRINRMGVVRYLELDKPKVVEALIKKYKNKKQGADLLIRLLREKYERSLTAR